MRVRAFTRTVARMPRALRLESKTATFTDCVHDFAQRSSYRLPCPHVRMRAFHRAKLPLTLCAWSFAFEFLLTVCASSDSATIATQTASPLPHTTTERTGQLHAIPSDASARVSSPSRLE